MKLVRRIPLIIVAIIVFFFVTIALLLVFIKIDVAVRVHGVVVPEQYIEVQPEIDGIISKIHIRENQFVKKGQLLAKMDDSDELTLLEKVISILNLARVQEVQNINKVKVVEEAVVATKIKKDKYKEDWEIAKEAHKLNVISLEKLRTAELSYKLSLSDYQKSLKELELVKSKVTVKKMDIVTDQTKETQMIPQEILSKRIQIDSGKEEINISEEEIKQALADLEILKRRLIRKKIYAPISGIILTQDVEHLKGNYLVPGEKLLTIGNLDKMVVQAQVLEKDAPKIKVGQKTNIYVSAFPYREFKIFAGEVIEMAPAFISPRLTPGISGLEENIQSLTSAYTVVTVRMDDSTVEVDGKTQKLKPGLTAEVDILIKSSRIIVLVVDTFKKAGRKITNINLRL